MSTRAKLNLHWAKENKAVIIFQKMNKLHCSSFFLIKITSWWHLYSESFINCNRLSSYKTQICNYSLYFWTIFIKKPVKIQGKRMRKDTMSSRQRTRLTGNKFNYISLWITLAPQRRPFSYSLCCSHLVTRHYKHRMFRNKP